jgi:hypothetical protein
MWRKLMRTLGLAALLSILAACSDAPSENLESGKRDRSSRSKSELAAPRASDNVAVKTVLDPHMQALEKAKAVEAVQAAADRQRAIDAGLEAPQ